MTRIAWCLFGLLVLPVTLCAAPPTVTRLEIFPSNRVIHAPGDTQQLAVTAHFSDGSQRDVTRLTVFESSDDEIATVLPNGQIRFHRTGEVAIICRYRLLGGARLTYVDAKPGFVWPKTPEHNLVDQLAFAQLKRLQFPPSELCADHVFVRRAYIDLHGTLPTPAEVRRFLDDRHPLKRSRLIDELLGRPAFAEYWAHHWVETLGLESWHLKKESGIEVLRWFRGHIEKNTPLDQVVRDLLIGREIATEHGPVTFYTDRTDPSAWADRAAEAFLGLRTSCVQCHAHSQTRWRPDDRHHFVAFFAHTRLAKVGVGGKKVDTLYVDRSREWVHPETLAPVAPRFLDGGFPKFDPLDDRRVVLADWLTSPKNPYFARTMVNRIWRQLNATGFVDPPETLHEATITTNDALLDALARSFVAERFDVKQMIRIIMNARTYQLSAEPSDHNKSDDRYFSRARPHFMKTVVALDALSQLTEVPELIEEVPPGMRTIHVVAAGPVFIRYRHRGPCEGEPKDSSFAVLLHYLQGESVVKGLKHPRSRVGRLLAEKKTDREMLDELCMAGWARLPTPAERKTILAHVEEGDRRLKWDEVLWALISSREFLQRR